MLHTRCRTKRLLALSALAALAGTLTANAQVTETRKLSPVGGGAVGDAYGFSVDVEANLAVIGAWTDSTQNTQAGAVYIVDVTTGEQLSKFYASDPGFWGGFGTCIDIQGDLVAIGARIGSTFAGSVYLYDISNPAAPVEITRIAASDGAQAEFFGTSVAIAGNNLVVGAPSAASITPLLLNVGAAYVYDISNPAAPVERFKLQAPFPAEANEFGINVAAEGNIALVGEWWSDIEEDAQVGQSHLFDLTTGTHLATIAASDADAGDEFGVWAAISGNTAVIGTRHGDGVVDDAGAAYQFDITNPAAPVEVRKLIAADGVENDEFGRAVHISGDTIIIGSQGFDEVGLSSAGAAYLFDAATGAQIEKFVASDPAVNNGLGNAVRLSADGSRAMVSSWGASNVGAVYVYDLVSAPACPADLDSSEAVDVFDLLAYLDLWFAADPAAELTSDDPASIDVFDLLAYLDLWFAGC